MRDLPPGWAIDLAILEHSGSTVEDRGDHLVVRTPDNPYYHWGHCLFVTDEDAVDDAGRWVMAFHSAFPEATWVAIGLLRMPEDQDAWVAQGLDLELDEVLTTRTLPRQVPLPKGYAVRRLSGDDWAQSVARRVLENDRTGEHDPQSLSGSPRGRCGRDVRSPSRTGGLLRRVRGQDTCRRPGHRQVRYDGALPERRHR